MKCHVSTHPTQSLETSEHPESLRETPSDEGPGGILQPADVAVAEYRHRAESRASSSAHLPASGHLP